MAEVVGLVIVGLMSFAGVVYTAHSNRKANDRQTEVEASKVDSAAFERAREADAETIKHLREEVDRERMLRIKDGEQTQREIERLQRSIDALRVDLSGAHRENQRLLEHIDKLEATVARLRARLATAGFVEDRGHPRPPDDT